MQRWHCQRGSAQTAKRNFVLQRGSGSLRNSSPLISRFVTADSLQVQVVQARSQAVRDRTTSLTLLWELVVVSRHARHACQG